MTAGNTIISASIGKEGIKVENGKNIFIDDSVNNFIEYTSKFLIKKLK